MTTVLLIVHGLCAVLLIGAVTHQAIAELWRIPRRPSSFVDRARAVAAPSYSKAVVVLYVCTLVLGAVIYPAYTLGVRAEFREEIPAAFGVFEVKEHFAAIGLAILPAYWYYWGRRQAESAPTQQEVLARRVHTVLLAVIVWFDFVSGHVLNNLGGL